ncbi:MAG: FAD-binding oxidoreductase [Chloroflexi bacterium]|nr:MAG: FAD-binding oxidoreductase [Chloroflexota bacterium]
MELLQTPTLTTFAVDRWADLQARVQGRVITPDDLQYTAARQAWNLTVDQYPAAIVAAQEAADVAEAVRFAREHDLGIAVQATGHGNVRPANGALLILTAGLDTLRIDPARQTAWVGAGLKWQRVLDAAQAVGLAPLLGSSPDVGAVGYTLGGGMGWLARKYGLSADSVHAFEVVTMDGQLRRASAMENSDLFWGLRGGGGSLGIVTSMEIQLYPVTTVYGGNLFYPIDQAQAVFVRYREWVANAPDELTSSIVIMNFPPIPDVPEPMRGQSFVIVRGCYAGPVAEGEKLLQFWRAWQTPLIDDFKPMPFSAVATISAEPIDPLPIFSTGAWLRTLSDEAIATLIRYGAAHNGSPLLFAEVRHAGGAMARVQPEAGAYSNRGANHLLHMLGIASTPEVGIALRQHTDQVKSALQPDLTGGVYMNFLEGEESRQRVSQGFTPAAYQRLTRLKAVYDAENRLAYAFNITPA